ncbi:MAG: trypsin-like peptidase domain-containing protein [Thermoleophilia bacterium]|nr:trypsin-like peptidase domain-containing protein [Thermoleophilia bacterium]
MIDVLLVLLFTAAGAFGWHLGGAFSLLGLSVFLVGGIIAAAVAVAIGSSFPAFVFLLGGLFGTVPVALRASRILNSVRARVPIRLRLPDRVVGFAINLGLALVFAWYIAAIALVVPGTSKGLESVRAASLMNVIVEQVPPQGTLGALVLRSGFLPAINGPIVIAEAPEDAFARAPAVIAARRSVVQVRGIACNQLVTGTAWVVGPGLLMTNAHVVAGEVQTAIAGGPSLQGSYATVTAFDPVNDLAILSIDRQLPAALPLAPVAPHGTPAAVIGFPFGQEQQVVAARVDRIADFQAEPITGGPSQPARIFAFRGDVEPGNSGGPVIDLQGRVLAIVVAKGLGQRVDAGYGVSASDFGRIIAEGSDRRAVSTGECLDHE